MTLDWSSDILDVPDPAIAWQRIFANLLHLARGGSSPVALHDQTIIPDRLLSEAAWELWEVYPQVALRTSTALREWCASPSSSGRAVLIIDALSLRELPLLLGGAEARNIPISEVKVTSAECPSTTDQFAKAIGVSSRSALQNNNAPASFKLFPNGAYTDVTSIPFEDYAVPPTPNLLIWHAWMDDQIHIPNRLPDQITASATQILQSDGFWKFIDKLRQGRQVVITSDHGYAASRFFSSPVTDPEAIQTLRQAFSASRCKPANGDLPQRFMPPIVMRGNEHHVVMGQWKWPVQGGFPHVCHGGMSLLEVAVPFVELPAK